MPSQPEPRQDVALKAFPPPLYNLLHTLRKTKVCNVFRVIVHELRSFLHLNRVLPHYLHCFFSWMILNIESTIKIASAITPAICTVWDR